MYKLTQTGIEKVRQLLDKTLPKIYNALHAELSADSSGQYDTLVDFTDFSQVSLLLFSEADNWHTVASFVRRTGTTRTFSTLTFRYPQFAQLKVVFLFQRQPGKSILPDQEESWRLLSNALRTSGLPDEVAHLAFLSFPEVAEFADADTAQMLHVLIKLPLEDADMESI